MADIKFSEFPKATTSKDTDELAILQDGVNKMIASPVLESKIINKTVSRVIEQGGASLNVINLKGVVPTYANLATITPTPELNNAYQVESDGLVYVYTENGFQADGDGFVVQPEPIGLIEEGDTNAVSGGEVFENIKSLDLLVFKKGTNIANNLGVLNKDSVNVTKDLLLTKLGSTATAVNYNTTSLLNITQDLDLKIFLYGANASICFYDENDVFLEGYDKIDLDNVGLLTGNYLTAKISQITANVNVKKFRFCFFDDNGTIINEIKLTEDSLKNNTLSVLNFNSEQSINSKSVKEINDNVILLQSENNKLKNHVNILTDKIEEIEEKEEALIIENLTYTLDSIVTDNPKNTITITNTNNSVLTGDFSSYGASKLFPCVLEYEDGTFESMMAISFTSTELTLERNVTKNVVRLGNVHDENLGQHLSDLGCKGMGYNLYHSNLRTSYRQKLIKGLAFKNYTIDKALNKLVNLDNGEETFYNRVNNYPQAWVDLVTLSPIYRLINNRVISMYPTSVINQGIEFAFNSDYIGYVESYVGTTLDVQGNGVVRLLDSNRVLVSEQTFKGSCKRIIINHGVGDYYIQFLNYDGLPVGIGISQVYFWKKREIPTQSIFKPTDRVLFFTDSWGVYPTTTIESEKTEMFNGFKINGKCFMPKEFTKWFVSNGGIASNVILATRGGFTTEWAKYWINEIVSKTNPDKIVFNFGINDRNSISYYDNIDSAYDFSPTDIFNAQTVTNGGIKGSLKDRQQYYNNLVYLKNYCIKKGITPVFFSTPKVATSSQTLSFCEIARDYYLNGKV